MDLSAALVLWPGWIALAILLRVALGCLDHQRIHDCVKSRGGRVISLEWIPFGPGWFAGRSGRIYEIRFADRHGHEHCATCSTGLFAGVFFSADTLP